MNKRLRLTIAIAAGLLAAIVAMGYLSSREAQLIEMAEPLRVVIATTDIAAGEIVTEDVLAFLEVPGRFAQPGYMTDTREAVDRVARVPVLEGEQLTPTKLISRDVEPLANLLQAGYRAVTLAVNDVSGVAGLMHPGDYVDVVGIFELGRSVDDMQTQARFLIQRALVAAVDQMTGQEQLPTDENTALTLATVTLSLQPEDAQRLVLAQTIGRLTLLLRSRRDGAEQLAFEILDPQKLLGTDLPIWSPALEEAEFQRQMLRDLQ